MAVPNKCALVSHGTGVKSLAEIEINLNPPEAATVPQKRFSEAFFSVLQIISSEARLQLREDKDLSVRCLSNYLFMKGNN